MHTFNFKLITCFIEPSLLLLNLILHNTELESRSIEKIISESVVCRKINPKENNMNLFLNSSLGNRELKINSSKVVLDFTFPQ